MGYFFCEMIVNAVCSKFLNNFAKILYRLKSETNAIIYSKSYFFDSEGE